MATLEGLEQNGLLVRIEIPLDGGEQIWRRLFGTPDFVTWLEVTLPQLETTIVGGEITPIEQVDARFHEYVIGEPMQDDRRFRGLSWTPDRYVWELKTLDIRVFGWVPSPDCFICTFGDTADRIKLLNAYGSYIARTVFARDNLPLDPPKFVASKDYADVLSDAE